MWLLLPVSSELRPAPGARVGVRARFRAGPPARGRASGIAPGPAAAFTQWPMLTVADASTPSTVDTAQWTLWDEPVRVSVTDPSTLRRAEDLVRGELDAIDVAASRLRSDSELASAGDGSEVSPLLAELVAVALSAARDTEGDVDPTVGGCSPTSATTRTTARW